MATITYTIPNAQMALIVQAVTDTQGYRANIGADEAGNPIPNPETPQAFTKRMIAEYIRGLVKLYQRKQAEAAVTDTPLDIS